MSGQLSAIASAIVIIELKNDKKNQTCDYLYFVQDTTPMNTFHYKSGVKYTDFVPTEKEISELPTFSIVLNDKGRPIFNKSTGDMQVTVEKILQKLNSTVGLVTLVNSDIISEDIAKTYAKTVLVNMHKINKTSNPALLEWTGEDCLTALRIKVAIKQGLLTDIAYTDFENKLILQGKQDANTVDTVATEIK